MLRDIFALFCLDSGNVINYIAHPLTQDTWNQCYKYPGTSFFSIFVA